MRNMKKSDMKKTAVGDKRVAKIVRVRGDTKTIKIKLGKHNKLANILDRSFSGDGFYVDL